MNNNESSPTGTIAQLGERATEVRKVAGSIPARPTFFMFPLGERATEVRKVAGSIPARPMFLHLSWESVRLKFFQYSQGRWFDPGSSHFFLFASISWGCFR
ncbi:hypothetical protein N7448_005156 [Penicillium atrosanguineum]|uniref:Uncharacterized protein n=1 Tax=Penicillium atrosanguineum TaxID=1132637 RepID=A0A9W9U2A4_9EURO|nr:hypothetical protein N7448_005156 [Penicillium atrosanguineum]KAJ5303030.1 hypothetical protein N7476_009829 [Penicillium atrosanguineum]